jgi:hypothetical protein
LHLLCPQLVHSTSAPEPLILPQISDKSLPCQNPTLNSTVTPLPNHILAHLLFPSPLEYNPHQDRVLGLLHSVPKNLAQGLQRNKYPINIYRSKFCKIQIIPMLVYAEESIWRNVLKTVSVWQELVTDNGVGGPAMCAL